MTSLNLWSTSALGIREGRTDKEKHNGVHERTDSEACGAVANNNGTAEARLQSAVLTIARLLGRQLAREQFAGLYAANDNRPTEEIREPRSRQA